MSDLCIFCTLLTIHHLHAHTSAPPRLHRIQCKHRPYILSRILAPVVVVPSPKTVFYCPYRSLIRLPPPQEHDILAHLHPTYAKITLDQWQGFNNRITTRESVSSSRCLGSIVVFWEVCVTHEIITIMSSLRWSWAADLPRQSSRSYTKYTQLYGDMLNAWGGTVATHYYWKCGQVI